MPALLHPGVATADIALLSIFTGGGFSTGELFWRATAASDLNIDLDLTDAVLAGYLRPFAIREDVLFVAVRWVLGAALSVTRPSRIDRRQSTRLAAPKTQ